MTETRPAWYYRPWFVILMIFFVLGPLGLPFLFKSPLFSKPVKIILACLVVLITVFVVWESVRIVDQVLSSLSEGVEAAG